MRKSRAIAQFSNLQEQLLQIQHGVAMIDVDVWNFRARDLYEAELTIGLAEEKQHFQLIGPSGNELGQRKQLVARTKTFSESPQKIQ